MDDSRATETLRYLKNDNHDLGLEFTKAFENLFQTSHSVSLELLAKKILTPYDGWLVLHLWQIANYIIYNKLIGLFKIPMQFRW
jgi:hypothetical protein